MLERVSLGELSCGRNDPQVDIYQGRIMLLHQQMYKLLGLSIMVGQGHKPHKHEHRVEQRPSRGMIAIVGVKSSECAEKLM